MIERKDTMPGAFPIRMSDDQLADYVPRNYVATGDAVSSETDTLPVGELPPHTNLPPRAAADEGLAVPATRSVQSAVCLTSDQPRVAELPFDATSEHIDSAQLAAQRVINLCKYLDADRKSLSPSEQAILRAEIGLVAELARLANERLNEVESATKKKSSTASRRRPKKSPVKKKRVNK